MRYVQVTLAPEGAAIHPLFPVMSGSPAVDASWMLDWNATDEETTTTFFRVDGDPDRLAAVLAAEPVVREFEVFDRPEGRYAYVHTAAVESERRIWRAFTREGALLIPPITYRDGRVTCRVVGTGTELRAAVEAVPDGLTVTVDRLGEFDRGPGGPVGDLTGRQREAVRAALDAGYYEVPRGATTADVADRLDCAPSTAAEHLRRAEAALVTAAFSR
ncbi:MAG: helix-turn-helix domain-containing protein [Haloferacaceae archaeon]